MNWKSGIRMLTAFVCMVSIGLDPAEAKEPHVRGEQLGFTLSDLDGRKVRSSDEAFEGKVVFMTLWGTWCPPCRSEIPTFVKLQDRYRDEGLVIVGIAFERDKDAASRRRHLRDFSEKHDINYLILDGGHTSEFSDALPMVMDVKGLPVEIVIDHSGKVVSSRNGYGYAEEWARELEKELRQLLSARRRDVSP